MTRILNAEPLDYSPEARAILQTLGEVVERPLDRAGLIEQLPDYHVLLVRLGHHVDRELLDAGRSLRAIVSATTGLDHIDVEDAHRRGIEVLSLRGETGFLSTIHSTAEHTWGLLLALQRRIVPAFMDVQRGNWDRDRYRGHELAGKRLGLLGLGRLGRRVARYGRAFDMQVGAYDPYATNWLEGIHRFDDLAVLLAQSDVVSLHLPLTEQTENMIGPEQFAQMAAGSVLINTARGRVIDQDALLQALQQGRLAGAALDVLTGELGDIENHPLVDYARHHANLLLTPHIGGATFEAMARTEVFMARKLASFLRQQGLISA